MCVTFDRFLCVWRRISAVGSVRLPQGDIAPKHCDVTSAGCRRHIDCVYSRDDSLLYDDDESKSSRLSKHDVNKFTKTYFVTVECLFSVSDDDRARRVRYETNRYEQWPHMYMVPGGLPWGQYVV